MATTMDTTTPTETAPTTVSVGALLPLMWLASPALPVGGFSYSEGLEAAVDAGLVHNETTAATWLVGQLHLAQARNELAVVAQALPAWRDRDWDRLTALDGWVRHTRETAEGRLQTEQMGRSVVEWLRTLTLGLPEGCPANLGHPTLPVAYALALALRTPAQTPVELGLTACAFGWAENMVQAAIKAVPLGQGSGQRILAQLCDHIPQAVQTALAATDTTRQAYSPMLAILSAQHEIQYSRLFRS
ncbi:MAG: urease accessory protein UreF [Pseudomonadota bacterium]|jgi:urease accessory protein